MQYGKQFWINQLGEKWTNQMQDTLRSPYMDKLMGFLSTEYALNTIMPEKSKVFLPFKLCPWEDLKVVIIGHEPFMV